MSDMYFVGSIVSKLPVKGGDCEEAYDELKRLFGNVTERDEFGEFEVKMPSRDLHVELNCKSQWVIRKLITKAAYDGHMKITLADILDFKKLVESYIGENILTDEDITVQAYDWYTASEEPLY